MKMYSSSIKMRAQYENVFIYFNYKVLLVNQYLPITSAITFEAGDKNLKFLNNMLAIGHGKKVGNRIQIDYYILED